jgi:HEAT repeat protein
LHLSSTALEVLGQAKDPAALTESRLWVDHEKPRPKSAALAVLKAAGEAGERESAEAKLRSMLGSSLPQENIAAAQAIAALRDVSMVEALRPLLQAPDGRVRATAVHAYAGLGLSLERDCADEVAAAMDDKLETVRLAAVKRLSAVHSEALRLRMLAAALSDPAPSVRRAAKSVAMDLLPQSAASLAEAFADQFHYFEMQSLLAEASRTLEPAAREPLLDDMIRRHLETARQKREAAAQLKASGMVQAAMAKVLHQALQEEVLRHLGAAVDLLAERIPCEAMYQVAGALHSQDAKIRAQGLESLQCMSNNELVRGIADLADQPELKLHGQAWNANQVRDALASIAHKATPWLCECIEGFLGKTQENGRPGYAV